MILGDRLSWRWRLPAAVLPVAMLVGPWRTVPSAVPADLGSSVLAPLLLALWWALGAPLAARPRQLTGAALAITAVTGLWLGSTAPALLAVAAAALALLSTGRTALAVWQRCIALSAALTLALLALAPLFGRPPPLSPWLALALLPTGLRLLPAGWPEAPDAPRPAAVFWSAMMLAVALLTLIGWLLADPWLVQAGTDRVPSQFNTALSAALSALALWLQLQGHRRFTPWLLAPVFVLALATLAQQYFGSPIAPGQWLFRHPLVAEGVPPGRMAPNTAIALLLGGIGLLLAPPRDRDAPGRWATSWAAGLTVGVIAAIVLLGYLLGAPELRAWGLRTPMALPTALALAAYGLGLGFAGVAHPASARRAGRWLPMLAALAVMVATILIWAALSGERKRAEQEALAERAERIEHALSRGVELRRQAFERLLRRLERSDALADSFRLEADSYLHDFPSLGGFARLDADHVLLQARPDGMQILDYLGRRLPEDPARTDALRRAAAGQAAVLSRNMTLLNGASGQLMIGALHRDGAVQGYVIAALSHGALFPGLLADLAGQTALRLRDGMQTVYATPDWQPGEPSLSQPLVLAGQPFVLDLQARAGGDRGRRLTTGLLLLTGLAGGFLLALALRWAAVARERAAAAEAARAALEQQVRQTSAAEDALSVSRRQIIAVLESVTDAVVMVDRDWNFFYVNPRAEQLIRRRADELLGQPLWQEFPEAEPLLREVYERAMYSQQGESLELFYPPLDTWFEIRAYPHTQGLAIYFTDISARKAQQLQLERSELLLRAAGRSARLGAFAVERGSDRVYWSDEICALHEVPAGTAPTIDEAIGYYLPAYRDTLRAQFERCLEDGTSWDSELEMRTAGGRTLWVRSIGEAQRDEAGRIVGVHGAFQDISVAKAAELALRRSADDTRLALESMRQIMDAAVEVICSIDADGAFLSVNRAAEAIWGWRPEQLVGTDALALVHADDVASTRAVIAQVMAGPPVADFRNRNLRRDGRVVAMQWSASWSQQTHRLYCIGRDRSSEALSEQLQAGQREVLTEIAAGAPLVSSLQALCRLFEARVDGALCSIMLLDARHGVLHVGAGPSLPARFTAAIDGMPIGADAGICGTAAWTGKPVIVERIDADPRCVDYVSLAAEHGLVACWSVPVLASTGEVLATFAVYHRIAYAPSANELGITEGLAAIAAIALEQAASATRLLRNSRRLQALAEASIVVNRSLGSSDLYQQLVDRLRELVGAGLAALSLSDGDDWSHAMTAVSLSERHADWRGFAAQPTGAGIYRRVFAERRPLRLSQAELEAHESFRRFSGHAGHPQLRGLLAVPLLGSDDSALGVLQLSDKLDGEFDADDEAMAVQFAHLAATAIERNRLMTRLRERDRFFDGALELFCVYDPDSGRFLQINPAFVQLLRHDYDTLLTRPCLDFVHPDDRDMVARAFEHMRRERDELLGLVCRLVAADGSSCWLEWAGSADESGHYYLVARNITERRRIELERDFAETHDAATGLPRYPVLEIVLADMLDRGLAPTLFFIDLDRLHAINESMGHGVGDRALIVVAGRLVQAIGEAERVARFAGDEFVAVLPGLDGDEARAVAERLRAAIAEPIELDGYRLFLTTSIGLARAPLHGDNSVDLLRRAEAAMTQAKGHGGDTVREFSAEHMQQLEDRRLLGGRLREAIGSGELSLYFQPRVAAGTRALNGFEALARWHSSELGPIPPDRFVPIAEALGLMPELGVWVLQQACRQIRTWREQGFDGFSLAVNVSAHQLQRPDLVEQVRQALAAEGVPPAMLEIELTESSLMENIDRVQATLAELKRLGVSLSLDDFGTGYSSLAYLKQFSLDKLKIDRRFVTDLPDDANDVAIARTIVAMAHQLKMTVAAEGVETEAQARFLTEIGCDELQGYWFGRPLPAEAAEPLFAARSAGPGR